MAADDTVQVTIDPADFARLVREVRSVDKTLATALRRRIREAAQPAVADVKTRLSGGAYRRDVGLRRGLAAGTKVSIRTGLKTAGVSIVTTAAKLPTGRQAMVFAFDKPSFRHPVFPRSGEKQTWAEQKGRPYFGSVLAEHAGQMEQAVGQAVLDAARTVSAGVVS